MSEKVEKLKAVKAPKEPKEVKPEDGKGKKQKKKMTPGRIVLEVVEWFFVAVILVITIFILMFASKNPTTNSNTSIFGYETRLVISGSMDQSDSSYYSGKGWSIERIKTGSLVFLDSAPINDTSKFESFCENLKVGDVITFNDPQQPSLTGNPITHRIMERKYVGNSGKERLTFITHGDNNPIGSDETVDYGFVLGKVIGQSYFLGQMYINFFSNKYAVAAVAIVPSLAVITYEVIKIVKVVKEDKKSKLAAVEASKTDDDRIKELEAQIANLKNKKKDDDK